MQIKGFIFSVIKQSNLQMMGKNSKGILQIRVRFVYYILQISVKPIIGYNNNHRGFFK